MPELPDVTVYIEAIAARTVGHPLVELELLVQQADLAKPRARLERDEVHEVVLLLAAGVDAERPVEDEEQLLSAQALHLGARTHECERAEVGPPHRLSLRRSGRTQVALVAQVG